MIAGWTAGAADVFRASAPRRLGLTLTNALPCWSEYCICLVVDACQTLGNTHAPRTLSPRGMHVHPFGAFGHRSQATLLGTLLLATGDPGCAWDRGYLACDWCCMCPESSYVPLNQLPCAAPTSAACRRSLVSRAAGGTGMCPPVAGGRLVPPCSLHAGAGCVWLDELLSLDL